MILVQKGTKICRRGTQATVLMHKGTKFADVGIVRQE